MIRILLLAALGAFLAGCGMNSAIGVLPNAAEDFEQQSRVLRGDRTAEAVRPEA